MTRPRHLPRIAAATVVACLSLVVTGCFGGDDDPDAASCSKSTLSLRVVAGPQVDPAATDPAASDPSAPDPAVEGEGETTTTAPVDEDASEIQPGSTVEATGARLDDRCDDEAGEPLTGLRLAVVQGDVDLNVAGVDADRDGAFVVTFGLPEHLPAGPAEIVVRGSGDDADVLAKASFEVAPTS